jgi:Ca2+-binding EF-hand superfamily protein
VSSNSVTTEHKTKQKEKPMKIQCSSTVSQWTVYLLAGCLMALGQTANAQEYGGITTKSAGGGVPVRGVFMVLNGQDIGSSLLKACDTNQDGVADPSELNAALLTWFQQADTDSNGTLSETELATALKSLFPAPQPPPGAPPFPEDLALHNLLAKTLMATVDSNNDGWMTFQEGLAFVSQTFAKWDANSNGSLDASELAAAFAQLMPAPPTNRSFGTESGPVLSTRFDR